MAASLGHTSDVMASNLQANSRDREMGGRGEDVGVSPMNVAGRHARVIHALLRLRFRAASHPQLVAPRKPGRLVWRPSPADAGHRSPPRPCGRLPPSLPLLT